MKFSPGEGGGGGEIFPPFHDGVFYGLPVVAPPPNRKKKKKTASSRGITEMSRFPDTLVRKVFFPPTGPLRNRPSAAVSEE